MPAWRSCWRQGGARLLWQLRWWRCSPWCPSWQVGGGQGSVGLLGCLAGTMLLRCTGLGGCLGSRLTIPLPPGCCTTAAQHCAFCCLPGQLLEYSTLSAYGWSGWFSLWNALDLSTYVLQAGLGQRQD